jgi:MFS family permease
VTAGWFIRSCLSIFLLATALFSVRPMVSYRALELGATTAQIGLLAASYGVLSFLIAIPTGQWIDRIGETRFIVAGSVLMTVMSFWLVIAGELLALGIAQAVLGAGQIFGLVALQALVANCGPPQQRDARFGIFSVMASLGHVAGPGLAGLVASMAEGSPRQVFFVSGVLLIAAVATGVSLHVWPPKDNQRSERDTERGDRILRAVGKVLGMRSMPQAMLASVTVLVTIDLLVAYLPAYGEAQGISVATVGLLLSVRAAASALSRLVMVAMINAFGRRRVFVLSLAMPAVALLLIPVLPQIGALYVLMAVAGFGLGLGQPMSVSWVATAAPVEFRGIALGVRLTGNRLGQVVLPAALGAVGGATSVTAIFVALGAMLGGSSGVILTAQFEDAPDT